ncbi:DNA polymerase III subunit alpha [Aurantibacillus circumpalustris]|uniref:DNA polymerase III subunit alpha n=1 Tax=Aurantibacillus circumpalustris TaxID=3036359 RepID=UPI00295B8048|nr:DNA polymerase III subunit alpha [Aurantibacillus circumpalustris]
MFLIFDTETTGLPRNYNAPVSDSDNWPRMVQIAWQLHDAQGNLLENDSIIVKPEGYSIPFATIQIHGITNERANEEGRNLKETLQKFSEAVAKSTYLCGHNIEFDINIIGAELFRCGIENLLETKASIDTKNDQTTEFCAISGGRGGKFKWPTLTELHQKLFNKGFDEAHNAAFDVAATAKVFFEIIKRGITKVREITSELLPLLNYQAPDFSELAKHEAYWRERKTLEEKQREELKKKEEAEKKVNAGEATHAGASHFNFSHLHNHTQFSVLQSTSDVTSLVAKALEFGSPGVALTDHGNMYGAFLFWKEIDGQNKKIKEHNATLAEDAEKKQELKCIIGCEVNICVDHKDKTKKDNGNTQVLIAKNRKGYENLCRISSIGLIDGAYYVPRIDKDILEKYKEGLIATTGSLNSEVPYTIINLGEQQGEAAFLWYKEQFGEDFYVEINRQYQTKDEEYANEKLLAFARKHNVPYFAANSNYYIDKKGSEAHDILLCVKDGEKKSTAVGKGKGLRYGMPNQEFYFKSPAEMAVLFKDLPEALHNTNLIVDKIEQFKLGREVLLPKFEIAQDFIDGKKEEIDASFQRIVASKEKQWQEKNYSDVVINDLKAEMRIIAEQFVYMTELTYIGAAKRYPDLTPEIKERIDFELATIERMGYPGYFLIVADFISEARRLGVSVGPGRGSAAGSAIAYCLGITNVDPIKFDLLFERFLNPDRISMPDIDIDFDDEGRGKVIDYVINKYGSNQVAQIITYGTMGGKSAIKDTARVLDLPLDDANRLTKMFPDSLDAKLKALLKPGGIDVKYLGKIEGKREVIDQSHTFRKLAEEKTPEADVLKQAYELEGCLRNTGIHACGVIITPGEMVKYVPVTKGKESEMLVTQFDNSVAESAGLLKMDFLGLRTLTIIKDAISFIKQTKGIEIDIDAISLEDEKTYELFQRGETNGIFQYESAGMQKSLKELKPDAFTDLIAMNALYRPGPIAYIPNYINRKHGRELVTYDLEGMDEFLKETYGITVYQEQVMRLSQKLANFTKGDADVLRKAMGKKDKKTLDKLKPLFIENATKNGHDATVLEKVWKDWEAFASYAFNKSHSTCYAYVAFQTAYLKAHYPSEYMASTLNHSGSIEAISFFMEECKRMGIRVLGPDINEGFSKFMVTPNGDIRFGMASIKGVGENTVKNIIDQRNENGNFVSVFDLAQRLDSKSINKKSLEGLALAGGFDSFVGVHRAMFFVPDIADGLTLTDKMIKYSNQMSNGNDTSQASLFGGDDEIEITEPQLPTKVEPWSALEQLSREKEVVGFFISGHPLDPFKTVIEHRCNANCAQLKAGLEPFKNREVIFGGIVIGFENRTSKTGNAFGKLIIEDYNGTVEIMLFGKDFIEYNKYMVQGLFIFVKARVQERYNQPGSLEIKLSKIELLDEVKKNAFNLIKLKIKLSKLDEAMVLKLEGLMNRFEGKSSVEFYVEDEEQHQNIKLFSKKNKIAIDNEFLMELEKFTEVQYDLN